MSKDFSAFLKGRLPKDVPPIKGQKTEGEPVDHKDKIKVFDDPSRLFPSAPRISANLVSREVNGPTSSVVQELAELDSNKPTANTVEEPFKYRSNTVEDFRLNTVEEPFKYRLNGKDSQPEYRLTTGEIPLKNRLNTVEKQKPIETLAGRQKTAFFYLVREAKENGSWTHDECRLTPPVSSIRLAQALRTGSYEATRGATNALKRAQLLKRHTIKKGPGGFTVYSIPKAPYLEALNYLSRLNTVEEPLKNRLNTVEQTVETSPSSSRDFLIKEESTSTQPDGGISQIDLGRVRPLGITESVLARCIQLYPNLQTEHLEVLVFRFAEFAKDPKNKVQNARGFFISLAKQASEGQVPLDHIETPDERLMRLFLDRQKEAKARRVDIERAAQDFECESWLETLTSEMKLTLVPETSLLKQGTAAHAAMLKRHFAENVWPVRRTEILKREVGP